MSEDDYTRPERFTERHMARRRWEKRYAAKVRTAGLCSMCIHRDRHNQPFGRSICCIGTIRQHPECEKDGQGLGFEVDAAAVDELKDAA